MKILTLEQIDKTLNKLYHNLDYCEKLLEFAEMEKDLYEIEKLEIEYENIKTRIVEYEFIKTLKTVNKINN